MSAQTPMGQSIAAFADLGTVEEAAFIYQGVGLSPIPAYYKAKKPKIPWQNIKLSPAHLPSHFVAPCNIQIQMGLAFGGYVDVDLDSAKARNLAPSFLPTTDCVFGRASSPASHYVYRVASAISSKTYCSSASQNKRPTLEVRSDGHLAIFPPSVHESEEVVRFEPEKNGLPSSADAADLARRALLLACAALLSEAWPTVSGCRQNLALAVAGGFLRGLVRAEVEQIIFYAAKAAGDEEAEQRKAVVAPTASKLAIKDEVQGWPTAAKLLGASGDAVVATLRSWLKDEVIETSHSNPNLICASDIKSKKVDWLWPGWLPRGTVVIFDGDPGQGKSTVAADLAAKLTTGKPFPDGSTCAIGNVLLVGCEDGAANTIKPRLLAAGADCKRIQLLDSIGSAKRIPSFPDDLPELKKAVIDSAASLVIIDPLMAFLGSKINTYSDHSIRTALGPLAALAEELNVVVLCIRHFSKQAGKSAIHKGGGSIGILAASRLAMLVCKDPIDPTARVLVVAKSNLAQKPKALRYRIVGKQSGPQEGEPWDTSAIEWVGTSDFDADELVAEAEPKPTSALEKAKAFIKVILEAGPAKGTEVIEQGKDNGHSEATLQRASKDLQVIKKSIHHGNVKESYWSFSEESLLALQLPQPSAAIQI